ncbi:MAG: topoisomerase C-terminal repeat-containing protein [Lachnospiraceae bacterium]|nr:topoisomerase C-terminal repeat-containing protein [Lachnospiraceae bacterium]
MGKALIITEKPSVAQEFAKILKVSGRQNGYLENESYVITWCVGHLVEMVYPEEYDSKYKKWKLEDLPFLPKDYKYGVIKSVSGQYDVVHKMLHREDIDTVYWAGDAGKEGQTIEENIRNFGGVREGMQELRVWIDSQTEEEILRGIKEAKPMREYANLGKSGIMRTIEDYAMGINFSTAMSVKYGNLLNDAAGTKSYTAIAVGRVMTCVLGMVVIREREIRNFIETPFYRIVGKFTDAEIEAEWKTTEESAYYASPLLYKENGFAKEEDAKAFLESLVGKEARVSSVEKGISKKKAPLLFNLAELQAECAKRFKISPDETLQIAQDLYEKKLTTYPRTDARVLSSAVAKEISKNVSRLKGYEPVSQFVNAIMQSGMYRSIGRSAYTDDSKITDHYAIIPTGQLTELNSVNGLHRQVYDLIVRRFLSIFYPPAEYQTVKFIAKIEKESFFAGGKILKSPGYLCVLGKEAAEEKDEDGGEKEEGTNAKMLLAMIEKLSENDVVPVKGMDIKEGKTSPPKRYTSGSMVLAMENAGQLIEDEELRAQIKGSGIGTSATRAEIIKKLVRVGYLNLNRKSQVLTPTMLGEMIFETVSMTVPELLNPKMTASWEKGLDGITRGTVDMGEYRAKLEDFIRRETLSMAQTDRKQELIKRIQPLTGRESRGAAARKKLGIKCPLCDGEVETTPFGYGCSNYRTNGCKFSIGTIAGRDLTEEEVTKLLTEGKTEILNGFVSKLKKKFSAALIYKKDENGIPSIQFDFSGNVPDVLEGVACPVCGESIEIMPYGYTCRRHRENPEACYFSIGKIAEKQLSKQDVTELIKNGHTQTLRGFKSKNGKKFDAVLTLTEEDGRKKLKFDFEHVEAKKVKDAVCPLCGGEILVAPFGYACANRSRDGKEGCSFAIGRIAEKDLTESNVRELLTTGKTGTIRGFKGKSGKKFDACLELVKEEGSAKIQFDFEHVEAKKVKDVVCPLCGGDIVQTPFGYGCAAYDKNNPESCRFSIGKIAGVKLKEASVKELLQNGKTSPIQGFVAKTGMMFEAALKLDEEKKVVFDFPEKEEPKETTVRCPKCGQLMKRDKWRYLCECGYSQFHTVAGIALTDEQMTQIFTEGRTKEPIRGFTSKAGNVFDAFLVLKQDENGKDNISFDFNGVGDKTEQTPERQPGQEKTQNAEEQSEREMPQDMEHDNINNKENEDGSLQNQ